MEVVQHFMRHGEIKLPTVVEDRRPMDQVVMGEPCLVNPNSYGRVHEVLQHIQAHGPRAWYAVGSDGVPYVLAHRLRDSTPQLHNILLLPGPGHIEMNVLRALFKLLWPLGLEQLAQLLGFKTPKALAYALKASDYHKSWQMLLIFIHTSMGVLLETYAASSREQGLLPTARGAMEFLNTHANPSLKILSTLTLRYGLSLLRYRQATREGCSGEMLWSRCTLSELFFVSNMTTYMTLYYRDTVTRLKAPEPIREFLQTHESFKSTENRGKLEGGDFVLEGRNRRCKKCLPPGVPSEEQWKRSCRVVEKIDKVCIVGGAMEGVGLSSKYP